MKTKFLLVIISLDLLLRRNNYATFVLVTIPIMCFTIFSTRQIALFCSVHKPVVSGTASGLQIIENRYVASEKQTRKRHKLFTKPITNLESSNVHRKFCVNTSTCKCFYKNSSNGFIFRKSENSSTFFTLIVHLFRKV